MAHSKAALDHAHATRDAELATALERAAQAEAAEAMCRHGLLAMHAERADAHQAELARLLPPRGGSSPGAGAADAIVDARVALARDAHAQSGRRAALSPPTAPADSPAPGGGGGDDWRVEALELRRALHDAHVLQASDAAALDAQVGAIPSSYGNAPSIHLPHMATLRRSTFLIWQLSRAGADQRAATRPARHA